MPRCMSRAIKCNRRFDRGGTISQGMAPNPPRMYDLGVVQNSMDLGKIERLAAT